MVQIVVIDFISIISCGYRVLLGLVDGELKFVGSSDWKKDGYGWNCTKDYDRKKVVIGL